MQQQYHTAIYRMIDEKISSVIVGAKSKDLSEEWTFTYFFKVRSILFSTNFNLGHSERLFRQI